MIEAVTTDRPLEVTFGNGRQTAVADAPRNKGGGEAGFGPHELLEAALATCMAMTLRTLADRDGLPLTRAAVHVSLDRSLPEEATYDCRITLDGELSDEQRERLCVAASRCPVGQTLARRVRVTAVSPPS